MCGALSLAPLGFLSRSPEGCQAQDCSSEADPRWGRRCRWPLGEVSQERPGGGKEQAWFNTVWRRKKPTPGSGHPGGHAGPALLALLGPAPEAALWGLPWGRRQSREGTRSWGWTGIWSGSDRLHLIWVLPGPSSWGGTCPCNYSFKKFLSSTNEDV